MKTYREFYKEFIEPMPPGEKCKYQTPSKVWALMEEYARKGIIRIKYFNTTMFRKEKKIPAYDTIKRA